MMIFNTICYVLLYLIGFSLTYRKVTEEAITDLFKEDSKYENDWKLWIALIVFFLVWYIPFLAQLMTFSLYIITKPWDYETKVKNMYTEDEVKALVDTYHKYIESDDYKQRNRWNKEYFLREMLIAIKAKRDKNKEI